MSPISETRTGLDLMAALGAPALLVGGGYLGSISHTLTALLALQARGLGVRAIVVSAGGAGEPPLAETVASLQRLAPAVPVLALARDGDPAPTFRELAELSA